MWISEPSTVTPENGWLEDDPFLFGVVSWKVLCHVSCREGTKWWGFDGGESCGKIRKNTFKKSTSIANPEIANPERGLDPKSAP